MTTRRTFLKAATTVAAGSALLPHSAAGAGPRHVLGTVPLYRQPDEISCGPTCCAMVLAHYSVRANVSDLKDHARTSKWRWRGRELGFTSPTRMERTFEAWGLPVTTFESGSLADVRKLIDAGRPPVLLVRSARRCWHYVVAVGYSDGGMLIHDPLGSRYWISDGALKQSWDFDGDLKGRPIHPPSCLTCGGDGKLARAVCRICSGSGTVKLFGFGSRRCLACLGDGMWTPGCPACRGSGTRTDFWRRLIESNPIEPVGARTMIAPDRPAG